MAIKETGPRKVAVPALANQNPSVTRTIAQTRLTAAGLVLGSQTSENTGNSGIDQVIYEQTPAPDTLVLAGSSVDIRYFQYVYPGFYGGFYGAFYGGFYGGFFWDSISTDTYLRLAPDGLIRAGDVEVGDELLSLNIEELSTEGSQVNLDTWNSETFNSLGFTTTTVTNVRTSTTNIIYIINGDTFSDRHNILVKRNGEYKFVISSEVSTDTDEIYNANTEQWEAVYDLVVENLEEPIPTISIDCEPYDVFFTNKMLVYNVKESGN
jgi:hypothetical protein